MFSILLSKRTNSSNLFEFGKNGISLILFELALNFFKSFKVPPSLSSFQIVLIYRHPNPQNHQYYYGRDLILWHFWVFQGFEFSERIRIIILSGDRFDQYLVSLNSVFRFWFDQIHHFLKFHRVFRKLWHFKVNFLFLIFKCCYKFVKMEIINLNSINIFAVNF